MQNIKFNGKSSFDFGIRITCTNPYVTPVRRQTEYIVPGRNGTVIVDDGSFENVQLVYDVASYTNPKNAMEVTNDLKAWLFSSGGYLRLEDSREPDVYRMARCVSAEFEKVGSVGAKVKGTITFDCLPERWLKYGEERIRIGVNASPTVVTTIIRNATEQTAMPLIYVGSCVAPVRIWVRQSTWYGYAEYMVLPHDGTIEIDARTRNAIYIDGVTPGVSANSSVAFTQNGQDDFELRTGESQVNATATSPADAAVEISIKPRWWTL